jgi:hypothetical protein
MTERILERRGDQVWIEYEDWNGNIQYEWRSDPIRMCACQRKPATECMQLKETTFTEVYSCGFVYRYTNTNGLDDNLISVKGKRIK